MLTRARSVIPAPSSPNSMMGRRLFPVHGDIAVKTIISVWLVYFSITLLAGIFSQNPQPQIDILRLLSQTAVSIAATWMLYRLMAGMEIIDALLCLTVPAAVLAFIICYCGAYFTAQQYVTGFPWLGFNAVLFTYLILAVWGGLYCALVAVRETREALLRSQIFEKTGRESQLRALRYQLNPHFVFNALNSVSSLIVDEKNREAEQLVDGLADYMRAVLHDDGDKFTSVKHEIAQQVRYLEIEKIRFPERLTFDVQIDAALRDWKIPALLLQPLVENAIKYGVARSTAPVHIGINVQQESDRLIINVTNTGRMPIAASQDADIDMEAAAGTGTGLSNVREQLKAVYGAAASLTLGNGADDVVMATIVIPDKRFIM